MPLPRHDAPTRPDAATGVPSARATIDAVARFVAELQAGWDERDADVSNRHLAADVVWGSPYGATVRGYDALHTIHVRLKRAGVGGPSSHFEIVSVLPVAADVIVSQVRRSAFDPRGEPVDPAAEEAAGFSEMTMYVLVRRDGEWWVAAGQNTPIRPTPPR